MHVSQIAADIVNYRVLLLPLSEYPTKFREELKKISGHLQPHSEGPRLAVKECSSPMIILKLLDKPGGQWENSHKGNRWPEFLPDLPSNDQEMAQLDADTQGPKEVIVEAIPPTN